MESKHTPGPWTWDEDLDALHPLWEMGMAQGYGYIDWHDRTKMSANARLIAAAPDLLDALKEAADLLNGYLYGPTLDRALAAIAKAEGRE